MSHRHPYRAEIHRVSRTGEAFAQQVEGLGPSHWSQPTPCTDWSVRTLVGHTASIIDGLAALATGDDLPAPIDEAELATGPVVAGRIRTSLAAALPPWRDVHLAGLRRFPWGTTPAVRALQFTAIEIVGHAWDLAVATGVPCAVRDDDAEALIGVAQRHLPGAARPGLFDAARPAPPGATALDRLAATLGRQVEVPAHG